MLGEITRSAGSWARSDNLVLHGLNFETRNAGPGDPISNSLGMRFMATLHILPDDLEAEVSPGETILWASLGAGSNHEFACGAKAECTTCRVWVLEGLENCSPRHEKEERWNQRLQFDDSMRLACQTTLSGDVTIRRLVLDEADHEKEMASFPEMNPGPVLQAHRDGRILLANEAARLLFRKGDLLGRSWLATCPGMEPALWEQVLEDESPVAHEVSLDRSFFLFTHRHRSGSPFVFIYGTDLTKQREAEKSVAQSQRMATLGTLAAGIAHELNNPAAAAQRSAAQLREGLELLDKSHLELNDIGLAKKHWEMLLDLDTVMRDGAGGQSSLDPLGRSDLEAEMEEWLDAHQVDDPWELAPPLVAAGIDVGTLNKLAEEIPGDGFASVAVWLGHRSPIYSLLDEIYSGTKRVSEIVGALRDYSYLGEAAVQSVDISKGLDNTLIILQSKLKEGIEVHREYAEGLRPIQAYGSELNQVWTNIIDNAAYAMDGHGRLRIGVRESGGAVVVEIEDDGPGIPKDVQAHIFDSFYTTKPPGDGTGLGLFTTYRIVTEKHKGTIEVESEPGRTVFKVTLPRDFGQSEIPADGPKANTAASDDVPPG